MLVERCALFPTDLQTWQYLGHLFGNIAYSVLYILKMVE